MSKFDLPADYSDPTFYTRQDIERHLNVIFDFILKLHDPFHNENITNPEECFRKIRDLDDIIRKKMVSLEHIIDDIFKTVCSTALMEEFIGSDACLSYYHKLLSDAYWKDESQEKHSYSELYRIGLKDKANEISFLKQEAIKREVLNRIFEERLNNKDLKTVAELRTGKKQGV